MKKFQLKQTNEELQNDLDLTENLQDAFDPAKTYEVGDLVIYDGKLYQCKVAIVTASEWDSTKWEVVHLNDLLDTINTLVTSHISNNSNPHDVTKAQVGLGNVDNKSEATIKSDFTGSIAAGNENFVLGKDIYGHTSNTSNPHSVTKAQVGLGNVDNTADLDKPISTATQTALDGKQDSLIASTNITIAADGKTISATDTTYSAGTNISIDANNQISATDTTYGLATSSVAGLVKSATTGTTANRDYNVQVKSDGTMKVNVPWTTGSVFKCTSYIFPGTNKDQKMFKINTSLTKAELAATQYYYHLTISFNPVFTFTANATNYHTMDLFYTNNLGHSYRGDAARISCGYSFTHGASSTTSSGSHFKYDITIYSGFGTSTIYGNDPIFYGSVTRIGGYYEATNPNSFDEARSWSSTINTTENKPYTAGDLILYSLWNQEGSAVSHPIGCTLETNDPTASLTYIDAI